MSVYESSNYASDDHDHEEMAKTISNIGRSSADGFERLEGIITTLMALIHVLALLIAMAFVVIGMVGDSRWSVAFGIGFSLLILFDMALSYWNERQNKRRNGAVVNK